MKLQNAKGTKDLDPEEKILMNEVVSAIRETLELYGFNPVEFPILERYKTLAAKFAAGEESDALKETFTLKDQGDRKLGLRFDLTVPFSRYIGMNPTIKMPFKKYVSGNVFRDGPVKLGRMREFFQLDPDIVGVKSVAADAEIISLTSEAFKKIGLEVYCEYNNRKLMDSILDYAGIKKKDKFPVIISIDKLKKIGEKGVKKELKKKGLTKKQIDKLMRCMIKGNFKEKIKKLEKLLKDKEGINEIKELKEFLDLMKVKNTEFNPSLARGLAYYTGPVYEFFLKKSKIDSSVAAGGRYDNMIQQFIDSKKEFPATGISFGISVIIEALKQRNKKTKKSVTQLYIIPIKTLKESLKIAKQLRDKGIRTDIDLQDKGPSKNLDYANSYEIPYVLFVGEEEIKNKKYKLKNMKTGKEKELTVKKIIKELA